MQKSTTPIRAAVASIAIGLGSLAFAQDNPRPNDTPDRRDQPQQQLEQTKRQEKTEMRQQGDRKVEVREMALWSLGELPPKLMHKAMENLADDPAEAKRAVMQAANIIELQASLAIQKANAQAVQQQARGQEGQNPTASSGNAQAKGDERISSSRGDSSSSSTTGGQNANASRDRGGIGSYQAATGGDWSTTRDQGLWRAAEDLRELAMKIEYKQVLTRDELRAPFARAAVAMAAFYQRSAEAGLQRQDEEQTGYTLKGASEYLAAAHAFGQKKPTPEVSRAIFDGDRLANQIVKLSKPTTLQKDQKNDTARNGSGEGDLSDAARTAGSRQANAQQLPQEAGQVVSNLGDAIRQSQANFGLGQSTGQPGNRAHEGEEHR